MTEAEGLRDKEKETEGRGQQRTAQDCLRPHRIPSGNRICTKWHSHAWHKKASPGDVHGQKPEALSTQKESADKTVVVVDTYRVQNSG